NREHSECLAASGWRCERASEYVECSCDDCVSIHRAMVEMSSGPLGQAHRAELQACRETVIAHQRQLADYARQLEQDRRSRFEIASPTAPSRDSMAHDPRRAEPAAELLVGRPIDSAKEWGIWEASRQSRTLKRVFERARWAEQKKEQTDLVAKIWDVFR